MKIETIIKGISEEVSPYDKHNDTVSQIERLFRKYGFYTTREYPIYKIKDGSGQGGKD